MTNLPIKGLDLKEPQRLTEQRFKEKQGWIFVGERKSGKSTLISHLLGAQLTYQKQGIKYLINHGNDSAFPSINNYKSCSKSVNPYFTENGTLLYETTTCSSNTKTQESTNLRNLDQERVMSVSQAKMIIVVNANDLLQNRGLPLRHSMKLIEQLLCVDIEEVIQNCMLVVTKVSVVYSLSDICDYITDILEEDHLQYDLKMLLTNLLNKRKILLYQNPPRMNQFINEIKARIQIIPAFKINQTIPEIYKEDAQTVEEIQGNKDVAKQTPMH